MAQGRRIGVVGFLSVMLAVSFALTGCSRHASEKQLKTLDETEAAAAAAEDKVAKLEKEKAELEAQLAQKQQELERVKAEHKKVEEKLAQ